MSRIIFERIGGFVIPTLPDLPDGTPRETDGVRFLTAEEVSRQIDIPITSIEEAYGVFLAGTLAAHAPNALAARAALRQKYISMNDEMFELFLSDCARRGIDPASRHIWAKEEYNANSEQREICVQLTVDGFYSIANSSPLIEGIIGPQWCGLDSVWKDVWVADQLPVAARTIVKRRDKSDPYMMIAHMADNQDLLDPDRHEMPIHMIGKRSACGAIRRALAERLDGIYSAEEMRPSFQKKKPAPVHPDDSMDSGEVIDSPRQFQLELIDIGLGNLKLREAVCEQFRSRYQLLYTTNLPKWRRAVVNEIRRNPDAYMPPQDPPADAV